MLAALVLRWTLFPLGYVPYGLGHYFPWFSEAMLLLASVLALSGVAIYFSLVEAGTALPFMDVFKEIPWPRDPSFGSFLCFTLWRRLLALRRVTVPSCPCSSSPASELPEEGERYELHPKTAVVPEWLEWLPARVAIEGEAGVTC